MRIAILLLLAASGVAAKEQKYVCPEEVPAAAVPAVQAPEGWSGFVPGRFVLSSAGVTLEHPAQRMVQLGDVHKLNKKRFRIEYPHLKDWKGEKWLTCQYGGGIELTRRLPDNTARCTMLYTPDDQGGHSIDITCG